MSVQSSVDLKENVVDAEHERRRRALHEKLGLMNLDYSQFQQEAPTKPVQDVQGMQKNQSLARLALIAQGVDAVGNAIGVSANQNWQPSTSPVGQLGIHAYDNIRNMDTDYRDQLRQWEDDVLRTKNFNSGLDLKQQESNMALKKNQVNNELDELQADLDNKLKNNRLLYEQGELNAREYAGNLNRLKAEYIQKGYNYDPATGALTKIETEEEEEETSDRDKKLFAQYRKYEKTATYDSIDGKPTNAAARHVVALEKILGDKLYLFDDEASESKSTAPYNSTSKGRTGQQDLVTRNEFRPIESESESLQVLSSLPALADKIKAGQYTEQDEAEWLNSFRKLLITNGVTDDKKLEEMIVKGYEELINSSTQSPSEVPQTPTNLATTEQTVMPVTEAGSSPSIRELAEGLKVEGSLPKKETPKTAPKEKREMKYSPTLGELVSNIGNYLNEVAPKNENEGKVNLNTLQIYVDRLNSAREKLTQLQESNPDSKGAIKDAEALVKQKETILQELIDKLPASQRDSIQQQLNN